MSLVYTADSSVTGGGKRNRLYIGGRSDAKNRDKLQQWGVKYILNVTPAKDAGIQSGVPNFFEKDRTFLYKRIPVYDASTSASDLLRQADDIVDFISRGLIHGAVLVHCNKGQSRSTTAALFFFLRRANMSLTNALEMIQRRRLEAEPIPAFREILNEYEATCVKERKASGSNEQNSLKGDKKKRIGPPGPPMTNANESDKRRRIGPSTSEEPAEKTAIGPSMPPQSDKSIVNIGPFLPSSAGASIGPSVRPTAAKESEDKASNESGASIGPSLPPSHY